MRGCIIRYFPPQVWWWRRRRRRILARRMVEMWQVRTAPRRGSAQLSSAHRTPTPGMWQANRQGGSMGSRPPGCGAKVRGKDLITQPLIQLIIQLSS
jgi:hypothetical protein